MPSLRPLHVSLLVIGSVFAFSFYRAATQSFTAVESRTFVAHVGVPLSQSLRSATAGDHGLFPLLMRACRRMLGRSEVVQRIPTLLGCALFLSAAWVNCSRAVGHASWLHPLGVAAMSLQPSVLDAFVAARGHGLALGLTAWASYMLWAGRSRLAAVASGLAIASSLAFAVPIAVGSLLFLVVRRDRFWAFVDGFAGPVLVIAFVFVAIPVANGWRPAPSILPVWPAIGLAVVIAAHRMPSRIASAAFVIAALGLVAVHLSQLRWTHFEDAIRESGMKQLMRRLADDTRNKRKVTLRASAGLEECARYYGTRHRVGSLTVSNDDPHAEYSIVVGAPETANGHVVVERHELSGTSLVRRDPSP